MKKILGALFCALPLFYACKSLPSDLATYSPVAIMTVYGNPSVPLYDEKTDSETVDDGVLSGAVNRLINKKNPEVETAQERIDFASALLSERMRDFGLEVIDPTVLKEGSAYKHAGKTFIDYLGNTVPAAGYDAITSSSGKLNRTVCQESGAKSTLYVKFRFQKVKVKEGVHDKGIAARLVMNVFGTDDKGKKIINCEYKTVSSDYAEIVKSSNWDKEKVVSLFPNLTNRLITQFLADYALSAGGDTKPADYRPTALTIKRPGAKAESSPVAGEATENGTAPESANHAVLSEKRATAKKLLERGMSAAEAAEITGLSEEEVSALAQ